MSLRGVEIDVEEPQHCLDFGHALDAYSRLDKDIFSVLVLEEFAAQQLVRADERAGRLRDAQVKREQAG